MLEFRPRTDVGLSIDRTSCWGTVFTFNIVKTNKNKWKYSMNIKSVKYLFVLCCVYVSETRVTVGRGALSRDRQALSDVWRVQ